MENNVHTNLDKVLNDILVYMNPELLLPSYKDQVDTTGVDKKKLEKYFHLLTNINYFYKKVLRYETYFTYFYPEPDVIEKAEALEYHIYSYMESFDILRNKIVAFLGLLKNDLKEIASNKQEIVQALKQFIDKVENTFNGVKEHRHPHHHTGYRFVNGDIVDATAYSMMLKVDLPLRNMVNIPEIEKRKEKSLEKAQQDYINLSIKNNEQITGLINTVFEKNAKFIYMVLNIKHLVFNDPKIERGDQVDAS